MNVSICNNISGILFRGFLGVSFLFLLFGTSHAASIETTGSNDCNRIDTVDFGNGYSLKHYSVSVSSIKNIGRTELYKDGIFQEYQDTVFLANGSVIWWYGGGACKTHSRLASANIIDGNMSVTYDFFNPKSYSSTTNAYYDRFPTYFTTDKKNITDISASVYAFGRAPYFYVKLNLKDSNINETANIASQGFFENILDLGSASSGTRLSSSKRYGTRACTIDNVTQSETDYDIHYTCNVYHYKGGSVINGDAVTTNGSKQSIFVLPKEDYDLCEYDESLCEVSIPTPTHLTQSIQSPNPGGEALEIQEVMVGEQIGKFQSGSGMILEVSIDSESPEDYKFKVDVIKVGEFIPFRSQTSNFSETGSGKVIIGNMPAGEYYWQARVLGDNEKEGDIIQFNDTVFLDADFIIYEGFEPYPYGYNFFNNSPSSLLLTGGIGIERNRIGGRKWDIFYNAFPNENFGSEKEELAAFESTTLNQSNPNIFNGGNCFGMALSSASIYDESNVFDSRYPDFTQDIGNDSLWNSMNLSYDGTLENPGNWNEYNTTLETILSNQLFQYDGEYQRYKIKSETEQTPLDISEEIKNNPGKAFVLSFNGYIDYFYNSDEEICKVGNYFCKKNIGHAVVPYKVEEVIEKGEKITHIYIWDNNFPFTENKGKEAYEQIIKVYEDGSWKAPEYSFDKFTSMSLVLVDEAYNHGPGIPIGLDDDMLLTLEGTADFIIKDNEGNETGYIDGEIIEEIPGSQVFSALDISLQNEVQENNWKQIYIPDIRNDISIEVKGNKGESYSLMVLGGDYYNKITSVEIREGEIDLFQSDNGLLTVDFDDSKQGEYDILMDDFTNTKVGTILLNNIHSISHKQRYTIDWQEVGNIIKYEIGSKDDEDFSILSIFNEEDELGSISGYVSGNTNAKMSGWKVYLDISNDGELQENTEPFDVTDKEGYYEFTDMKVGNHTLTVKPHKNWNIIDKSYNLFINKGQSFQNVNFIGEKINGKNNK